MRRRRYLAGVGTGIGVLASTIGYVERVAADSLSISIVDTNDPVEAGDFLEVIAEVENSGESDVRPELEFRVGGERMITKIVTIGASETEAVAFTHQTFPVREDVEFTVGVHSGDEVAERTVEVFGIEELEGENVRPGPELTVEPGTTVMFEVESDTLGEYGGQTQWYLDGRYSGWSMGPWYAEYYAHRGADHWRHTFESEGTYTVAAVVDGDEENRTARWTVDVTSDGVGEPTIEAARPDTGSLELSSADTVELEVDVSAPEGDLERVVWWLGHADVILGVSDVEGSEDTATLSLEGSSLCDMCPIIAWVSTESGVTTTADLWTAYVTYDPLANVQILETNAPVGAGEFLEVTAEVENTQETGLAEDVTLVAGDEQVDEESVTIGPGESETVSLGYETYPVRQNVEFPVRVTCADGADRKTVEVFADDVGPIDVTILETNDPVGAGEFLEVVVEAENVGESGATQEIHLYAGDRMDSESVAVGPGEAETVSLGYETYPVQTDVQFPVTVKSDGRSHTRTVDVFADGVPSLAVRILEVNDPVEAGEFLEVTTEIENVGEAEATQDVHLVAGSDRVDSETVMVGSGETETIDLGYETFPVRRDVEFPVTVETEGYADDRSVEVYVSDDDENGDEDDDNDGDEDPTVEFESCEIATVSGTFEDGDTLSASTGFYDSGGYGNTIREDRISIGEDVDGPFSGTIVFEVGDDPGVGGDDESATVTVTVTAYGQFGTAITGVRTPDAAVGQDYNHSNPHDCGEEIRPERPSLSVEDVTPLESATYDVTFQYENPNDESLFVASEFDGTTDDDPPTELESGTGTVSVEWTPQSDDERLAWEIDFSTFDVDETIRAETEPAGEYADDPALEVAITGANDPVDAGETLEVVTEVENVGDGEAAQEIRLEAGDDVVATEAVTVAGGETETVTLGYQTATVEQDVAFTMTVRSDDDSDEITVEVFGVSTEAGEDPDDQEAVEDAEDEGDGDPEESPDSVDDSDDDPEGLDEGDGDSDDPEATPDDGPNGEQTDTPDEDGSDSNVSAS